MTGLLIALPIAGAAIYLIHRRRQRQRRLAYIEAYRFPDGVIRRFRARRPGLTEAQTELVEVALRDYFALCLRAGPRRMVAMPSQVVDDLWHEFILFTRIYQGFCRRALGRFLHHTPAEAMPSPTRAQDGIRRTWRIACAREGITPRAPDRLPLLFAIDAQLAVADGFIYRLDCSGSALRDGGAPYCASDIGCTSGCAGDSGAGSDSSGDGGGDGGCSGGGCGGD